MFAAGITDVGLRRSQNQDAIFVAAGPVGALPNLFIVADGMGGHNAGDIASRTAVETFVAYAREASLPAEQNAFLDICVAAAAAANRRVYTAAAEDPLLRGMGTTLTACVFSGGKCEIAHIGDSRAYFIDETRIEQITTDHSYVNEMVKAGSLTSAQAREHPKRNVLTRALGTDPEVQTDGYVRAASSGLVLLCSDGLANMLSDDAIRGLALREAAVEDRVRAMVDEANRKGGLDNISAVLIDLRG